MFQMYQAFVILGNGRELAAEPRLYSSEAKRDADRMHSERDGAYRVVVLNFDDRVVYDLPAHEA